MNRRAENFEIQEKEVEKWEALMRSIRRAARILNLDLTEVDMPDYLNWEVASDIHQNLWSMVYQRRNNEIYYRKVKSNQVFPEIP